MYNMPYRTLRCGVRDPIMFFQKRKNMGKRKRQRALGDRREVVVSEELKAAQRAALRKYTRGGGAKGGGSGQVRDKKLRAHLQHTERKHRGASSSAAAAEILQTEEVGMLEAEGEVAETWRFSQRDIARNVDVATSRKVLDLALNEFGPYRTRFTRNGRHLLFGGARGHIALVNWQDYSVTSEWHVKETVRDVTPLHSFEMVAVAQRRHAYIYDSTGMEIHCLRSHLEPNRLEFLPYHWLLASVGRTGFLKYTDTSTGKLVVELRTKLGNCAVMCQNPHNAVIHLGHNNGVVTLWKPTMAKPLVTMMTHGAALTDCAVDLSGNYMVTTGLDSQMKVWDLRTYRRLHEYFTPTPATAGEFLHVPLHFTRILLTI
jgi:U3 small nucleolar RNA-associated protein 7